ncbi:MAG: EF-P lysine aminoacylase GenX [Micavibrio aeruginosavorus]|uniref:EF-P lysine aminoacylase GenX n=1 Tax=Micavibrio aeruginosavorus TaxID=349221 RepID=A0A2W5BHD3_9BACT|nr:MAG: EF-P lysine aminoacylase GenX [Micavibrio aeruginosavorus]
MWWHPENFSTRRAGLEARAAIMREIRHFFDSLGFTEVESPILQVCPVIDAHIRAFATDLRGVDGEVSRHLYLHTSPEFAMKKLLTAGMERIYQICHVFRNCEDTARHSPEFTMIEWYRTQADYTDIMDDCVGLLRAVARRLDIGKYRYKGFECDPFADFETLTVSEAFGRYAGFDLADYLADTDAFRQKVKAAGIRVADDDAWDDLFFRVMDTLIEPKLGMGRPTFLCDYPVAMASLSRPKEDDPRFAERFELYVCGVELANAFSELTDADVQRERYADEMAIKERLYGERYPLDEEFIKALEYGMPESGGIALGIDRLVMLAVNEDKIENILWCGKP